MRKTVAGVAALLAVAYMASNPASQHPSTLAPTDWHAASALAEKALDMPVRDPLALWRASGAMAIALAPLQPEPRISFARAGFFHWIELSAADRKAVLDAYAPVLRDEATFLRMYETIYGLTGDFGYLRRAQPRTPEPTRQMVWLAATYGLFDQYRALRDEVPDFATPVDKKTVAAEREIAVGVKTQVTDEILPYVEIYVDGVRAAEGPVGGEQTFVVPVQSGGAHVVEVRLANQVTRNNTRRIIEVTRVAAS